MAAKVDSAAVQDGYQLYHHAFSFSRTGLWCVIQQGMSDEKRTARRYHEPHEAICSDLTAPTLNLVAAEHESLRSTSVELASRSPDRVIGLVRRAGAREADLPFDLPTLDIRKRHALEPRDVDPRRVESVLLTTYERAPQDFETLLGMEGVGVRRAQNRGRGLGTRD